jgi:hypothetical protein
MPKGPKGEKRPADVIGAAVMVAKIATGEIEDCPKDMRAASLGRIGGKIRSENLPPAKRKAIAKKAAKARWAKSPARAGKE